MTIYGARKQQTDGLYKYKLIVRTIIYKRSQKAARGGEVWQ